MRNYRFSACVAAFVLLSLNVSAWGIDKLISQIGPIAQHDIAVKQLTGVIFAAVPATNLTGQNSVDFYTSTDNGDTWGLMSFTTTPSSGQILRLKMVVTDLDSVICIYLQDGFINFINLESGVAGLFSTTQAEEFDAAPGSGNFIYLFVQEIGNNDIRRYGTNDGGLTYTGNTALVTGTGYKPRVDFSGNRLVINYYGPVAPDTVSSVIRAAYYTETMPGTITPGTFQDVSLNTGAKRSQFFSVKSGTVIWFLFTEGDAQQVIKCRVSTDDGVSYQPEFIIAGDVNVSAYWMDGEKYSTPGPSGMTLTYYEDSLSGLGMELMKYAVADVLSPGVIVVPASPLDTYNDAPVSIQPNIYPAIINYVLSGSIESGVAWTVPTALNHALFYDHISSTTSIEDLLSEASLNCYPVPANSNLYISGFKNNITPEEVRIYDISGRILNVLDKSGLLNFRNNDVVIDVSNYINGIYFVEVRTANYTYKSTFTVAHP